MTGSKTKLRGYIQLERAIDKGRKKRFSNHEIAEIEKLVTKNRNMVSQVMKAEWFSQRMNTAFQELATYETEENHAKKQKENLDAELAAQIRQLHIDWRRFGEAGQRVKNAEIENIKQLAQDARNSAVEDMRTAQTKATNARLELLGAARMSVKEAASPDDYWDHSQEKGVAFIPDRLQEISPCWSCYSLYRFNQ